MSMTFDDLTALAATNRRAFLDVPRKTCLEAARAHAQERRDAIRERHGAGLSGTDTVRQLAETADGLLQGVFRFGVAAVNQERYLTSRVSLCALGGYGRMAMSPHSDLDVCLLYDGELDEAVKGLNSYLIPFLWDLGYNVGYAIRSLEEARELVHEDKKAFTSFWQARLLAGDTTLFARAKLTVRDLLAGGLSRKYMREVVHERFDGLAPEYADLHRPDPNIKENAGGLRDFHSALWLFMTAYGASTVEDVASMGGMTNDEYLNTLEAVDFLYRIRNELHFHAGKANDNLSFENQQHVAEAFAYARAGQQNTNRFMEDYYAAARHVRNFLRLAARTWDYQAPVPKVSGDGTHTGDPVIHNGELHVAVNDQHWFSQNPARLMEVFWRCASKGVDLSHDAERRVIQNLHLVNAAFRSSSLVRGFFLAICGKPYEAGRVLRQMASVGLLSRYMPEYSGVQGIIRYKDFHSYPVDEHTLRALEALAALPERDDPVSRCLRTALEHMSDPYVLVLAILFHDLGKAQTGPHVEGSVALARQICQRMGLSDEDEERILFLVEHHMLMSFMSQYRDVDDEEIAATFAEAMKTEDRLRALFLLSYADMSAVGPGVWNDWKGALLMKLYLKAEKRLLGRTESAEAVDWDSEKPGEVCAQLPPELHGAAKEHMEGLGERYFVAFPASRIAEHVKLAGKAREEGLAFHAASRQDGPHCEIAICTRDQRGLFAKLAGSFASQLIDVNGAMLFTRPDGYVIDCFTVAEAGGARPLTESELEGLNRVLTAVLVDGEDVAPFVEQARRRIFALLQPRVPVRTHIEFDDFSSRTHTVIDLETGDRTGLLYDVADAMTSLGLNIAAARIVTDARRVRDSFYVTLRGEKISDPDLQQRVRETIHAAIHPRSTMETKGAVS